MTTTAWALVGYPLEPKQIVVLSVEPGDRHTSEMVVTADEWRIPRERVYQDKPVRVIVHDDYGSLSQWQGEKF